MSYRRDRRRRRKNAVAAGQPNQIYLREASRRRRPWLAVGLLAVLLIAAAATLYALAEGQSPQAERAVRILDGKRVVTYAPVERLQRLSPAQLRAWLRVVPARRVRLDGPRRVVLGLDRQGLMRRARRAVAAGGGDVHVPRRAVSAIVRLPVVKQALRNNCETAALSIVLVARNKRIPQLTLQRQLARSRPLDPRTEGGRMEWGDPAQGFVGRPEGGGPAGGYGVYQQPVADLAERHGVSLRDLSGRRPTAIYRALLRGRPVMAWVGLSDGPFKTWVTPAGKTITGNFGEHTVVLTGVSGQRLTVNDPLSGRRLTWSRAQFETMWQRLGRRALTL